MFHHFDQFFRRRGGDPYRYLRVMFPEIAQDRRKFRKTEGLNGADMEGIFEFRFIADGQLRPIDLIEDIVSAGQKLASLRCECDLSSDPVE